MDETSRENKAVVALSQQETDGNFIARLGLHLKIIEQLLGVAIVERQGELRILGSAPQAEIAKKVLSAVNDLLRSGHRFTDRDIMQLVEQVQQTGRHDLQEAFLDTILISSQKQKITPKTPMQKEYIEAIRKNTLVIAIGPAGTGKTYLAMAMAVAALLRKDMARIILARPAVEAGESLGFLPGDMYQKVNPYLRPLYDALYDMMEVEKANRLVERGLIEIAPIAYMRGRTLNDSFIILDEAQNTTSEQMKMFLTRLGYNSKAVVTGDVTQIDLPKNKISGLVEIDKILHNVPDIEFVYFSDVDVIRHALVQRIVRAYERYHATEKKE